MAHVNTNIVGKFTVEQFQKNIGSKLKVRPVFKGSGADKRPLNFDGTDVQKWAVTDEAGNTQAWVSQRLCTDLSTGKHQKGTPLCIVQSDGIDAKGKAVSFFTLSHVGNSDAVDLSDVF